MGSSKPSHHQTRFEGNSRLRQYVRPRARGRAPDRRLAREEHDPDPHDEPRYAVTSRRPWGWVSRWATTPSQLRADEAQGQRGAQAALPAGVPQPHRRHRRVPPADRGRDHPIVDLLIARVEGQLANKDMALEITPAAKKLLAHRGFDPVLGARPLRRTISGRSRTPSRRRSSTASCPPVRSSWWTSTTRRARRRSSPSAARPSRSPCPTPRRLPSRAPRVAPTTRDGRPGRRVAPARPTRAAPLSSSGSGLVVTFRC